MAKITFVYPDFENLGVEYLMAACLKAGHEVDFVFYQAKDDYFTTKKKTILFSDIAKQIADTRPDFVAFSCITDNYLFQLSCAKAVKAIMPRAITVFGGIHPTSVPEVVLKEKEVDCVVIGEAEYSFLNFLHECDTNRNSVLPHKPVKGAVFKAGGEFIGDYEEGELPDLNTLPFPSKKPFYSRFKFFSRDYYLMTSRGCPFSCSYCFNSYMRRLRKASSVRQRTVDNVIAELLQAKRVYSPKYINFQDDCFTIDNDWIMEFCQRYKKEISLPFTCLSIPQYLNEEKIKALSKAGCYRVQIGSQSPNEKIHKEVLYRDFNSAKLTDSIRMLKDAKIIIQVDHILGIPGSTLSMEEENVLFYNRLKPHVISVYWLTYYPRTEIVDIARQKGLLTAHDIENINEGRGLSKDSFHTGGSIRSSRPYFGICLLMNYIPLLPGWLVRFSVKRKLYKIFSTKNAAIYIGLPRLLLALLYRKNFCDQEHVIRGINKFWLSKK